MTRCPCACSVPALAIATTRAGTETWCSRCRNRYRDALRVRSQTPAEWMAAQTARCRCGALAAAVHPDTRPELRASCAACRKRARGREQYRAAVST